MSRLRLRDGTVPDLYFVDLDGTLLSRSSEKLFLVRLFRRRILGPGHLIRFMGGYLLHPLTTLREGKGWNRGYLKNAAPRSVREEAVACAEILLEGSLRSWTKASIEELGSTGCVPVIISASLHYIAERIASDLGVDEVCASRPEISSGRFTGRLTDPRPWGREKRRLAEEICSERGTRLDRCAAAGDSWADRFILQDCGCPVAVCPDRRLGLMARDKGWTMVEGRHAKWA